MAIKFLNNLETSTGSLTITKATTDPLLYLYNTTNGSGATIRFSDQSGGSQTGDITFYHSDGSSQGGGASWHFASQPDTVLVVGSSINNGRFVSKSAGSSSEVDYGFYDDVNTGMYRSAADTVRLVAGGVSGVNVSVTTVDLRHTGSTKLQTTSTGVAVTGQLTVTNGIEMYAGNFNAGDGERIRLGNSADLQIYHDGSNSFIQDTGAGDLYVDAAANFFVRNQANGEVWIKGTDSGVSLRYQDSQKLITTNTGVTVTGSLNVNQTDDSNGIKVFGHDDKSAYSGNLYIDSAGNFQIRQTHGAGSGYMQIHAENYLELHAGSLIYTQANFRIYDAGTLSFGSGGDYKIKHNTAADNLIIHTDDNKGITLDNVGNATFTDQAFATTATSSGDGSSTLTTKGYVDAGDARVTPATPSTITSTIVGETIEIAFNQSSTSNIDYYQVWSSDDGGDYGIIAQITPADFSSTMTVVDTTFVTGGTMSYRVFAVREGIYSTAGTTSKAYTVGALSVTDMTVVNLNTAYYIQYEKPTSRFIDHVEIYMDSQTTSAALSRSNATIVYSGQNASYMRNVNTSSNFHQFWVEIVTS